VRPDGAPSPGPPGPAAGGCFVSSTLGRAGRRVRAVFGEATRGGGGRCGLDAVMFEVGAPADFPRRRLCGPYPGRKSDGCRAVLGAYGGGRPGHGDLGPGGTSSSSPGAAPAAVRSRRGDGTAKGRTYLTACSTGSGDASMSYRQSARPPSGQPGARRPGDVSQRKRFARRPPPAAGPPRGRGCAPALHADRGAAARGQTTLIRGASNDIAEVAGLPGRRPGGLVGPWTGMGGNRQGPGCRWPWASQAGRAASGREKRVSCRWRPSRRPEMVLGRPCPFCGGTAELSGGGRLRPWIALDEYSLSATASGC